MENHIRTDKCRPLVELKARSRFYGAGRLASATLPRRRRVCRPAEARFRGLVLNSSISAAEAYSESRFPGATVILLRLWNLAFSVGALSVLFAILYTCLPNASIAWNDVWMGAFMTAILFITGRFAIGLYLGRSATASACEATGTLVVPPLWLCYSAQVFLFGAEFTCIHATHRTGCRRRRSALPGTGSRQ